MLDPQLVYNAEKEANKQKQEAKSKNNGTRSFFPKLGKLGQQETKQPPAHTIKQLQLTVGVVSSLIN